MIAVFLFSILHKDISYAKDEGLKEYYEETLQIPDYVTVKAIVIDITFDDTKEDKVDVPIESDIRYQHLKIEILNGKHKGEVYTVRNTVEMIMPYKLIFKKNDIMLLRLTEDERGEVSSLKIYERSREGKLYFIVVLFVILLIMIGGIKGLKSALTLVLMGLLIIFVFIPLITKGYSPILVSIFTSIVTVIFTLTIISGLNKKTLTAILGTISGVTIAGILAMAVGKAACLTGVANEDAQMLAYIPQYKNIDYQGLLFGGIIIGALGAIIDVAMSVSSSMWEIKEVHPKIQTNDLIKSGMNIGKDIMGSMSNTLILAYVGTSIHLMIIFSIYNMNLIEIVNMDFVASEIIRAMAGSIGLLCSVPITVLIAAQLAKK